MIKEKADPKARIAKSLKPWVEKKGQRNAGGPQGLGSGILWDLPHKAPAPRAGKQTLSLGPGRHQSLSLNEALPSSRGQKNDSVFPALPWGVGGREPHLPTSPHPRRVMKWLRS